MPVLLPDWGVFIYRFNDLQKMLFIDINAGREPNVLGRDVFTFLLDAGKDLVTYGYNYTETQLKNECNLIKNRYSCSTKY